MFELGAIGPTYEPPDWRAPIIVCRFDNNESQCE